MFEKQIEKHQTKKQIEGSLEILVKALPSMEIDGKAQVNFNETENTTRHTLSFKFHGDAKLDKTPTSFNEAIDIFRMLPFKAQENERVVSFSIAPVSLYCTI